MLKFDSQHGSIVGPFGTCIGHGDAALGNGLCPLGVSSVSKECVSS